MIGYPAKLAELVDTMQLVDRQERIQLLIDIAKGFAPVPSEIAERPFSDEHKVPACESEAYVWAIRQDDDSLKFHFAVENPQGISAMAMAAILDDCLSGEPPASVAKVSTDIVYELFGRELSMGKSMGLMGMVTMVVKSAERAIA